MSLYRVDIYCRAKRRQVDRQPNKNYRKPDRWTGKLSGTVKPARKTESQSLYSLPKQLETVVAKLPGHSDFIIFNPFVWFYFGGAT